MQAQNRRNVQTTLAGRLRRHQVGGGTPTMESSSSSTSFENALPNKTNNSISNNTSSNPTPNHSSDSSDGHNNHHPPTSGGVGGGSNTLLTGVKKGSTPTQPALPPHQSSNTTSDSQQDPSSQKEKGEVKKSDSNGKLEDNNKQIMPIEIQPSPTVPKNGGSRAMRGMLTQASNGTPVGENQHSVTPSPSPSPHPSTTHQRNPSKPGARATPTTNNTAPLNHRKLALWQQQPMNLSPATHLGLPPMLPSPLPHHRNKPLLVLDVDETLVHASFTPAKPYNVHIIIEVDGEQGDIFVAYRPHLFTFLDAVVDLFEVAIFTASQSCYADQLLDHIDPQGRLGRLRLFREHCTEINGARVKDLSLLGRPLHRIALVDNSPVTYVFQPRNGIPILSWFEDPKDVELLKLLPMLRQLAASESVYDVLDVWRCSQ